MSGAWHNLRERLEELLAEMAEDNQRLRRRVAELEAEVNEHRQVYSPEVADQQALTHTEEG